MGTDLQVAATLRLERSRVATCANSNRSGQQSGKLGGYGSQIRKSPSGSNAPRVNTPDVERASPRPQPRHRQVNTVNKRMPLALRPECSPVGSPEARAKRIGAAEGGDGRA